MSTEKTFRENDIATARAGASVYYWNAAADAVQELADGMTLKELISTYCCDTEFAEKQVEEYLGSLPTHEEIVARAFILYTLLQSTRNELANIIGAELAILEEAARGRRLGKAVDDDSIRLSAGYKNDEEVADSSRTDAAQEKNVTDADIGGSAAENVTYRDSTVFISPEWTFRTETRRLAKGIVAHCGFQNDVQLLVEASLVTEAPAALSRQILELADKLVPPKDSDR